MSEAAPPLEDSPALRRDVIDLCLQLHREMHFPGTWGNVSVRVPDGVLVTPSRVEYADTTPDDLVVIDWDGNVVRGKRVPTSEADMHRILLQRRPDLATFLHAHSPMLTAVACAHRTIPVCVEDMAHLIGGPVRCCEYTTGGRTVALAEAAWEALGTDSNAVLLGNHGVVVGATNLREVHNALYILEKAAHAFVFAESIGGCRPLPDEIVREERDRYLYKYGKG